MRELKKNTWVMTPDGIGLFVGLSPALKLPRVEFSGIIYNYGLDRIRPATFLEFGPGQLPKRFGQTPLWGFVMIVVGCRIISAVSVVNYLSQDAGWWVAGSFGVGIEAGLWLWTWLNFKRYMV